MLNLFYINTKKPKTKCVLNRTIFTNSCRTAYRMPSHLSLMGTLRCIEEECKLLHFFAFIHRKNTKYFTVEKMTEIESVNTVWFLLQQHLQHMPNYLPPINNKTTTEQFIFLYVVQISGFRHCHTKVTCYICCILNCMLHTLIFFADILFLFLNWLCSY